MMTSEEIREARVSQASFGRLVGVSAMRVNQLIKLGLLAVDEDGVKLLSSLARYYEWRASKKFCGLTVEEYLRESRKRGYLPDG